MENKKKFMRFNKGDAFLFAMAINLLAAIIFLILKMDLLGLVFALFGFIAGIMAFRGK